MRFAVTGREGQLGRCLSALLASEPAHELVLALSHAELDIGDGTAVARLFEGLPDGVPDVLVNAAAYTAVDACESNEATAFRVNADGPGGLARRCRQLGVRLVHVSTDYVFDGQSGTPYHEDAPRCPRSAYGRSKAEGEVRVLEELETALVVRTSWVFGPGKNFVGAILNQAHLRRSGKESGPLRVVDDQRGCPTYALDLAAGIRDLLEPDPERGSAAQPAHGIFHLCNRGVTSWWGFAREILDGSRCRDLEISKIRTADLDLPAERPACSVLDCGRAERYGVVMRPWRDALGDYLRANALRANAGDSPIGMT